MKIENGKTSQIKLHLFQPSVLFFHQIEDNEDV